MRKHPNWLISTGLIAATLILGSTATTASAATAHLGHLPAAHISTTRHHERPLCITDGDGDCYTQVKGTAWPTNGTNIRSGPGTGYSIVGTMPHNGTAWTGCYRTGTNINGDPYWDYVASNWGSGYVSDYYFDTGGNITQQIDPC